MADKLAGAQIRKHLIGKFAGHTEGKAKAGAAPVKPQHEARTLRRTAMGMGTNAERPSIAPKMGARRLNMGKTRPPHQGAIAKHPKIAHIHSYARHPASAEDNAK
ncbi:hypothetical protein GCM10011491_18560 [Brucella endophytica]|uniref:Uncharacterized protein n=1 Tax=Brucella endophytica TaxID=1963359 RepID=A0A916SA75_9HYPH|nr:hypothetical protein GCM10011491_18560 [Brucella endophytica]